MNEHPYQLRRVELQDFKSVAEASVDLRPLTVVVGANSSGKSTLLQSILALTQAVRSDITTPEFPLNGEFVRLGTFQETRNFLAKQPDTPMRIAFDLVDTSRRLGWRRGATPSRSVEQLRFTWRAHLAQDGVDTSTAGGFARLAGLQIEVGSTERGGDSEETLRLTCDLDELGGLLEQGSVGARVWTRIDAPATRFTRGFPGPLTRSRALSASGRVVDWSSGASASVDAVALSGGLPTALLRRRPQFEVLADLWWDIATDLFEEDIAEHRRRAQAAESPPRASYKAVRVAATNITSIMEPDEDQSGPDQLARTSPREALLREIGSLGQTTRSSVSKSLAWLDLSQFRTRLRKELGDSLWIDEVLLVGPPGESGDLLAEFGTASQRFFGDSVRYLGPLREAPHVLYDPGPSKRDLGVAGQYSAAVLHAQANTRVLMPTPEGRGEHRPLTGALDFWLSEIGLVEKARSKDEGRMGIGLSVTPRGLDREVDLTSVGVGVSQVLPVILLCLLAEPGTLVILEQPELHLHPKLQQDLADFLLACTRAGRQLVIETHSEHLVNRLRYQIAKDETDETHGLIRLVFAENDEGITTYREPDINPYGGLGDDWPAGFLDLTAKESQELVRQSLAKRKRGEAAPGA
jgi:energy-coupling factor transporter ATP-binding protein EcfA2